MQFYFISWSLYFVNNSTKMSFGKLIHDMYDPNQRHKNYSTRFVHIDGASMQLDCS
jgi:hypothetical protein